MKTSPSNSRSHFSPARILWIVVAALVVSMVLYWALRLPAKNLEPEGELLPDPAAQSETAGDTMIGVQPASFQQISEYQEGTRRGLRLAGNAEPDTVLVLTNKGERLRQVRVNEQGQWGVTLDVESRDLESELMVIEAQIYTDENLPRIQSEETIFYIPVSAVENVTAETYTNSALIMVTAPGRPSRIIQSPFGGVPSVGPLSLSEIDYDHSGGIIITGSSSIPGRIRIYAQNVQIGETGIGVGGRWNYIAGRILPSAEVEIRAELIPAQGIPDVPEGPIIIAVRFNLLPSLQEETDGSGDLTVTPSYWQVRRTLTGGGGQATVIFAPQVAE